MPAAPAPAVAGPRLLYLPDAAPAPLPLPAPEVPAPRVASRCPPEMVSIRSQFCIDRWEETLVDATRGRPLSPYYHPTPECTRREWERWQRLRSEQRPVEGRSMPVPPPPEWELSAPRFEPMAVSSPNAIPNGYLSGQIAEAACTRAGKRLCTPEEWVTACRGEKNRKFPYGHHFEDGRCNVYRATHPARLLHGDASAGHLDPRLNQVTEGTDPLLRLTGGTPGCASEWNGDAVYDMVGNLDEWVADPDGTFVGGFYARSTREGCDARVEVHSYDYYDYSLGTRCCLTP
ncbi:MAG TPA: SUMF1/EgtB/PvdO family nonheme iron enzyme [Polyangiaceae bacterium]|nr:SUMF1/EgtB/PvdO family nonheme iron enzyme [Polyangiaceae bacterium]